MLTKERAAAEIAAVEDALREGYPAIGTRGSKYGKSATRIAADRLGTDPQSFRDRVGSPGVAGSYWRMYQMHPDWSLERPGASPLMNAPPPPPYTAPPAAPPPPPNPFAIDRKPQESFIGGPVFELVSRPDNTFLFGAAGDLHAGSKYTRWDVRQDLYRHFIESGAQCAFDTGNWIEGEATFNRYDLEVHGLEGQCGLLAERHPRGLKTFAVWGDDHEGWLAQREGVNVGKYTEAIMRTAGHEWSDLGFMEAHVILRNANTGASTSMAVVHPGGGSAYATSYAIQKIIESLEGGEKPAVGLYGHYHKLWAGLIRNVWCVQTGCQQDQTPFMRKKRLEAHVGGVLVKLRQDPESGSIISMTPELIRYFNRGFHAGTGRWSKHGPVTMPERSIYAIR